MTTCRTPWLGRNTPRTIAFRHFALLLACIFAVQAQRAHSQEEPGGQEAQAAYFGYVEPNGGWIWDGPDLRYGLEPGEPALQAGEAQDAPEFPGAWDEHLLSGFGQTMLSGALAGGYGLFKNTILMFYNTVVLRTWWATPTASSIRRNLTTPWQWEGGDGFMVNYLGHPIQGMIYFGAGRATGFGFYQSIFFSVLGSAMWEAFFEYAQASINDLFTTAPAGLSLGEMMFRLYMQAHAAGVPAFLTFFINPAVGFHRLVTRWEPPPVERNLYEMRFYLAAAFGSTNFHAYGDMVGGSRQVFSHAGPFASAGFSIVYGDPFVQGTWVPFRHFEFFGTFGTDVWRHADMRVFSDGYLFSFSPLYTETRALSHGPSLHLDFASVGQLDLFYSTINMYSNALGWTVKYRHLLPSGIGWRARLHAGFTFFGASNFHQPYGAERTERMNYGYGASFKHISSLEFGRRNRLDVNNFFYLQWNYPGTSALSQGFVWWQFHDVSFSRLVSPRVSLGANFFVATERGFFGDFPSTRKSHWSVRTFVAWNGNNIREPVDWRR